MSRERQLNRRACAIGRRIERLQGAADALDGSGSVEEWHELCDLTAALYALRRERGAVLSAWCRAVEDGHRRANGGGR